MWMPQLDPVVGSAGAAILCTLISQICFSRQSELYTETLSWLILPLLFSYGGQKDDHDAVIARHLEKRIFSSGELWAVAVSIAVSSLFKAEVGVVYCTPVLIPLLVEFERRFQTDIHAPSISTFGSSVSLTLGYVLAALFASLTLSRWDLRDTAISVVAGFASLLTYLVFLPRTSQSLRDFFIRDKIDDVIRPLSRRVVATLILGIALQVILYGFTKHSALTAPVSSLAKALSWYFTLKVIRHASWCIVPPIATFSLISSCNPFQQSSEAIAVSHVAAAVLMVAQIVHMLPARSKGRSLLVAFTLIPLIPYLLNAFTIKSLQSSARLSFSHSIEHPVENLAKAFKADFENTLRNQSKNYTAACIEYQRRYSMEPPEGFYNWYSYAVAHNSPIIDDFDTIYDSVSPFWTLSGNRVREIMNEAVAASNSELWLCNMSSNTTKTQCSHAYRTFDRHIGLLFDRLKEDETVALPNVKFLVNHLDEPRVLLSHNRFHAGNSVPIRNFSFTNPSQQSIWETSTRRCVSRHHGGKIMPKTTIETFGLPFVKNHFSDTDLCQHPEYRSMHGLFISPTSERLVEGPVPILSTGAPSTMGDILFPSPAYIEAEFQFTDTHDMVWSKKKNNLYWAGSNTGGFATNDQWRNFQRQRFVAFAQNLERKQHNYLKEQYGVVRQVKSFFLNSRLFDVTFTRVFQCERRYCRDQRAHFRTSSWTDPDRALRSRLVFDIDGNGISGRFYRLLASNSLPLKQTLLHEWHDDRLIPWVHYIPISQGMEEVPELVTYLTENSKGQERAHAIAEQGRDWFSKAFREVDRNVYTYRLLLELARLQDPKREGIGFSDRDNSDES